MFPAIVIKGSDYSGRAIEHRLGKAATDTLMRSILVVVVLETGEFSFQIPRILKWHVIEVLAANCPYQALDERT